MGRKEEIRLADEFREATAEELIGQFLTVEGPGAAGITPERIALASSMGAEDQVLTHLILARNPAARIFILDTGRLHDETHELMRKTMARYGHRYEILTPDEADVAEMVAEHGLDCFYESVELRKKCCFVRKVKPLRRMLSTLDAWITGQRRGQSVTRASLEKLQWDEANGLIKLNPLADWSDDDVWAYIKRHTIPYNALHDRGYPSIGCAPCSRAVEPGEDSRAGRWWWESPEQRECGLHLMEGKLVRRT